MENDLIVYAKYDENNSIVSINSNIFIDNLTDWKQIDKWVKGQDRYLYSHAGNGDYIKEKHGKSLYDENGKPNFHDDFVEYTDEEKEKLYPTPIPEPTEFEKLKMEQEVTAQAVQDLILMMMGGE